MLDDKGDALDYMEKAIKADYQDYSHMRVDQDLDNIRYEEKFKTLLEPLRETGDYLYILKKTEQYNSDEKSTLPGFIYKDANNPQFFWQAP